MGEKEQSIEIKVESISVRREPERVASRLLELLKEKETVFLLSDTAERLAELQEYVSGLASELSITGSYALSQAASDPDTIVNEINAVMPDVVLSAVGKSEREQFLSEKGTMFAVKHWVAIEDFEKLHKKIGFFSSIFRRFALK